MPAAGDDLDGRYAADAWQAGELGVPAARGAARSASPGSASRGCGRPRNAGPGNDCPPAARSTRSAPERLRSNGSPVSWPTGEPPATQAAGHRPGAAGTLPGLAGAAAAGRLHQGPVPGVPARRSWRRTGATAGCRPSRPRRRSTPTRCPAGAASLPRFIPEFVMDQLESDGQPRPAAAALPGPDRADRRDRAAGRGRLRVAVRPACSPTAPAGRACGSPARRCAPNTRCRCRPGRSRRSAPSNDHVREQPPRRVGVAVPVTVRPAAAGALRHAAPGLRRLAAAHRPARRDRLRHNSYHPPVSGTPSAPG